MPGMDGLELQEQITLNFPNLAVIIITGHGDVPIAVRAMKGGAMDFVEKPFVEETIVASVRQALEQTSQSRRHASDAITATARLKLLTAREREVLNGLVAGLPNKTIAADLGISPRTVEIHRAHIMGKMQADSLSSLVRMAIAAGALN